MRWRANDKGATTSTPTPKYIIYRSVSSRLAAHFWVRTPSHPLSPPPIETEAFVNKTPNSVCVLAAGVSLICHSFERGGFVDVTTPLVLFVYFVLVIVVNRVDKCHVVWEEGTELKSGRSF